MGTGAPSNTRWRRIAWEAGKILLVVILAVSAGLVVGGSKVTAFVRHILGQKQTIKFVELAPPSEPISLGNAHLLGNPNSSVGIVEYADFECPACAVFARETFPQLKRDYIDTGKVAFMFQHYAIEQKHPAALMGAQIAECKGQMGDFWSAYSWMFEHQRELEESTFQQLATILQLPSAPESCSGQTFVSDIRAQGDAARKLGVRATPSFLVGQRLADGRLRVVRHLTGAMRFATFQEVLNFMGVGAEASANASGAWSHSIPNSR